MIDEEMCWTVLRYVGGFSAFTKLEVYNQLYWTRCSHHSNVQNATQAMIWENNIV